jgi:hypothetical protein
MELRGAEAKQKTIYNIIFCTTFFHTRKFWVQYLHQRYQKQGSKNSLSLENTGKNIILG